MLLFHGGGWAHGSRRSQEQRCNAFTAHGFVAVPVDYRLADGSPGNVWPAQLQDAQLALRWVRANAARYGIDPRHVCAYGESAGGQLALLLGEDARIIPGDMQARLPDVSPHADCVASVAGPTDLVGFFARHPPLARLVFGPVTAEAASAAEQSASPVRHLGTGMPPVLLVQGVNDTVVPPEQAIAMLAALTQAGVPAWLITHSGGHVFRAISPPEAATIWNKLFVFFRTLSLAGQPAQTAADTLDRH